ncbi:MAG: DUF5694 domain-containing protein [Sphingomonas bacterium]
MRPAVIGIALGIGLAVLAGAAGARQFDPRAHRVFAGAPSEVLVLGTTHLSGLPDSFAPAQLDPLLDRLAKWKPAFITIEALSGPQCEYLRRYAALHPGAAETYCFDPAPAQKALGMDMAAATIAAEQALAAWPASPSPAQRRHLAALFLAGGDRASALVQWLRLDPAERRAGDGLDDALAAELDKTRTRRNENYLIAAALAARLGLERVYPVDDHTADDESGDDPAFGKAIEAVWKNPAVAALHARETALEARIAEPGGMLALYRYLNSPEAAEVAFGSDFGAALVEPSPQHFGRRYVGWWETRNLRMVANIRSILARHPGGRALAVVGVSHKGYFEAYLGMMHDVKLGDAAAVLR